MINLVRKAVHASLGHQQSFASLIAFISGSRTSFILTVQQIALPFENLRIAYLRKLVTVFCKYDTHA